MTYKQKYDSSKTWQKKVFVMSLFHQMKCYKYKWNMRKTAKYFDVCVGLVSENIKLAKSIKEIKHIELRRDALLWLKKH